MTWDLIAAYLLAVILTAEQAFDCISTNLVLSKGRGHEGNGLVAKWMGLTGQWWWTMKLPVVAIIWYNAVESGAGWRTVSNPFGDGVFHIPLSLLMTAVMVGIYGWVLVNNYKIAWRQK